MGIATDCLGARVLGLLMSVYLYTCIPWPWVHTPCNCIWPYELARLFCVTRPTRSQEKKCTLSAEIRSPTRNYRMLNSQTFSEFRQFLPLLRHVPAAARQENLYPTTLRPSGTRHHLQIFQATPQQLNQFVSTGHLFPKQTCSFKFYP